jgi:hypothetical protein
MLKAIILSQSRREQLSISRHLPDSAVQIPSGGTAMEKIQATRNSGDILASATFPVMKMAPARKALVKTNA